MALGDIPLWNISRHLEKISRRPDSVYGKGETFVVPEPFAHPSPDDHPGYHARNGPLKVTGGGGGYPEAYPRGGNPDDTGTRRFRGARRGKGGAIALRTWQCRRVRPWVVRPPGFMVLHRPFQARNVSGRKRFRRHGGLAVAESRHSLERVQGARRRGDTRSWRRVCRGKPRINRNKGIFRKISELISAAGNRPRPPPEKPKKAGKATFWPLRER